MPGAPITHFDLDPDRLAVISQCRDNYGVGDPEDGTPIDTATAPEWPNNLLSRRTVVYSSGRIARGDEGVRHAVDPDELALCRRLSAEAAALMAGVSVGMGSDSGDGFRDFFIAANVGEPLPTSIDEGLIRRRFGGTIFPPATVTVEPLVEKGAWWQEVSDDGDGSPPHYFVPWRRLIEWFGSRPEFTSTAFIRIGDSRLLWQLTGESYPPGTECTGCVLPRLALGLTRRQPGRPVWIQRSDLMGKLSDAAARRE